MQTIKQTIYKAILYISTVVLVAGVPLPAFADRSEACMEINRKGKNWVTNPDTGECVKVPKPPAEQSPSPSPSPSPVATETPSPSPAASQAPAAGSGGDTTVTTDVDVTTDTTIDNDLDVNNDIDSTAQSGDAGVRGNQSSGNANSGDANAVATVVNSVHSTVDGGKGVAYFTADINGNIVGDITLGPTIDDATIASSVSIDGNTNINNDTNLTNDIDVGAVSGDAKVRGNESTGSATSGNANTVVDVLNLINTIIAANKSFVGTINIYGNLDGDILISPEFIPQLLASNSNATYETDLALAMNINDDKSIVNNVNLQANSGDATVQGNGSQGSATSGNTQTNLTILNLTGHEVNAANSLLVFVNVLGTWVGMIVDAPGATAAALGNGVTSSKINASATANVEDSASITNNINLASQSGDASVKGNQSQGNATSGNATASANIANISKSTFNLSDWFGVLYINVFGSWKGWFGVDTEAGSVRPLGGDAVPSASPIAHSTVGMRLGFVPGGSNGPIGYIGSKPTALTEQSDPVADPGYQAAMLAAANIADSNAFNEPPKLIQAKSPREDPFSTIMMIGGFGVAGIYGMVAGVRRLLGK